MTIRTISKVFYYIGAFSFGASLTYTTLMMKEQAIINLVIGILSIIVGKCFNKLDS